MLMLPTIVIPFDGRRLSSVRRRAGVSIERLGTWVPVSANTVWRWESGRCRPSEAVMPRVLAIQSALVDFVCAIDGLAEVSS